MVIYKEMKPIYNLHAGDFSVREALMGSPDGVD